MIHFDTSSQAGLATFEAPPIPAEGKATCFPLITPLVEPSPLAEDAITSVPKAA